MPHAAIDANTGERMADRIMSFLSDIFGGKKKPKARKKTIRKQPESQKERTLASLRERAREEIRQQTGEPCYRMIFADMWELVERTSSDLDWYLQSEWHQNALVDTLVSTYYVHLEQHQKVYGKGRVKQEQELWNFILDRTTREDRARAVKKYRRGRRR